MRKIGILGGMAPESTLEYYRILVSLSRERGWGRQYPEIIIYSLNFKEFFDPLEEGNFSKVTSLLSSGIKSLYKAGADFALMASNTPHMFFDQLAESSPIPLLSIVEEAAKKSREKGFDKVGLWGTSFTMGETFYKDGFEKHGISLIVPNDRTQRYLHKIILEELVNGKILEETRNELVDIAQKMVEEEDIQALILGCTELPMIVNEEVLRLPVLNTTRIHAEAALNYAEGRG